MFVLKKKKKRCTNSHFVQQWIIKCEKSKLKKIEKNTHKLSSMQQKQLEHDEANQNKTKKISKKTKYS